MGFPNLKPAEIARATLTVHPCFALDIPPCQDRALTAEQASELLSYLSISHIHPGWLSGGGWKTGVTLQLQLADGDHVKISISPSLTNWVCSYNGPGDRIVRPGLAAALARVVAEQ